MKYDRSTLAKALKAVSQGLSSRSLVPGTDCFHFGDKSVWTSSDGLCFLADCEVDVEGCVSGNTLLGLVDGSSAKQVDVKAEEKELTIKLGRTVGRLALGECRRDYVPKDHFVHLKSSKELLRGLEMAVLCAGSDPSSPARFGLTLHFGGEKVCFYSTNNVTLSYVEVPFETPEKLWSTTVQLPLSFCRAALNLKGALSFSKNTAACFVEGLAVFGTRLEGGDIEMYEGILSSLPREVPKAGWPSIPSQLIHAIERATLLDGVTETLLTVTKEDVRTYSQTPKGEIADKVALKTGHEIEVKVHPGVLLSAMEGMTSMLVTSACIVLCDKNGAWRYVSVIQ